MTARNSSDAAAIRAAFVEIIDELETERHRVQVPLQMWVGAASADPHDSVAVAMRNHYEGVTDGINRAIKMVEDARIRAAQTDGDQTP